MAIQGRPRRITKLHVEEISLVDKPANKTPFLLYKRDDGVVVEGEDMEKGKKEAAEAACGCGPNCPADCDCDDPNCPHAGRVKGNAAEEGGMPAPGKMMAESKSKKADTSEYLVGLSGESRTRTAEATARGLVKYDSSAVADAIGRVLDMGKDSQAAINPDGPGSKPASGETSKDVNGWLKDLGGKIVTEAQEGGAGSTKGASQAAIDPNKAEGFSGGMRGPEGPKNKGMSGSPTTVPPDQDAGGSPKGASQAAI